MVRHELLGKIREMIAHANASVRPPARSRVAAVLITGNPAHEPCIASAGRTSRARPMRPSDPHAGRSIRACVRGVGAALPDARRDQRGTRGEGRHVGRMDRAAHRHPAALSSPATDETTSSLAITAAQAALAQRRLRARATSTSSSSRRRRPDYTFPATATQVQAALGITRAPPSISRPSAPASSSRSRRPTSSSAPARTERALVIGAETFSRILDWEDRTTCVLFGDGAGAIVLEARRGDGRARLAAASSPRICAPTGAIARSSIVDGGPSTTQTVGHLRMEGKEVFRHAVGMVTDVVQGCFDDAGVTADDLDWFVPHQANRRIIDASADKLGIAREKVVVTVDLHGNTSAASIPLALDVAVSDGRIKPGDLVMLEAMGGGFTWGAALIRW